jgi:hypothetical protein
VASALSVSTLAAGQLSLSWNADSTVLTINPTPLLQYQAGTSQAASARQYTVSVLDGATDLNGNALTGTTSATFSTLRRITEILAPAGVAAYDSYGYATGLGSIRVCPTTSGSVDIAWWSGGVSSGTRYGYVAYDATALAEPDDIDTFESATFSATQETPTGSFYTTGKVHLQKLEYGPLVNAIMAYPITEQLGVFSSTSAATPSKDITTSFWSSLVAGDGQQLFRLSQDDASGTDTAPEDGTAVFTCTGFSLQVVYLRP